MKILVLFISFLSLLITSIDISAQTETSSNSEDSLRIMFYNVENLFDPFDDSLTIDEEFTNEGSRHWTWYKFQDKLQKIYKTILAVGNPYPPAIIGLCEIENRFVLNQLVYETPFSKLDYRIVHEESPDRRGIDVALLFDPNRFELLYHEAIEVNFPFDPDITTRDILYVKGLIFNKDTIHLFVNHWPSRYGGQLISEPKRKYVADLLRMKSDSLFSALQSPTVIIMGDFNDEPEDESLRLHLRAGSAHGSDSLVNLMLGNICGDMEGSHKFQAHWSTLDQFIVSRSLLSSKSKSSIRYCKCLIFNASFLLEKDEKYLGSKPFRTFVGFKYNGGFSDHLPIYMDLCK